jgi:hypothetical protein
VDAYLERRRRTAVDCAKHLGSLRRQRQRSLEKSRTSIASPNGLAPAKSDNDLDPDENDETRAHDFEEPVVTGLV